MNGVNKVTLIGNLGKDPEIRNYENGKLAKFSLATNERYTSKSGDKITKTEWHTIAVWGSLSEIAQKLLKKGSMIYLEGKLHNYSYPDKEGNKRYVTEVLAENFTLLNRMDGEPVAPAVRENLEYETTVAPAAEESDLPF
ncbi:MAG: single-stranded DNA-binding protein [Bacteroidota bacterium]